MLYTFISKSKNTVLSILFISTIFMFLLGASSSSAAEKPKRQGVSTSNTMMIFKKDQVSSIRNKGKDFREKIVTEAKKYIGVPYVAYSADPSVGFDCSGFTMYVYNRLGINLPHSAREQANLGYEVSEKNAQPGDLVYMVGHIGFWVAPGVILDSPKPGYSVTARKLWTDEYKIIRVKL